MHDRAWQDGKTLLIVNSRHRYLDKSWGLSVEDLAHTRVHGVELRYRDGPSHVPTNQDSRKYESLENHIDEAAAHEDEADNCF